jgi:thiamine pyrophosphate-dependent acetolactate synthase large subunit-like protein
VSCGDDEEFDNYTGFLAALAKKLYGSTSRAKKMVRRVTDDQRKPKPQKPQKPQKPVDWLAEIEAEIDKYIEDVTDHQNNYPTRKTHLGGSFI